MPSQVHKRGAAAPEMNLTPLIDVVFQLIIFFMLVNNIVSAELAPMVVPDLEDPHTRKMTEENRVIVNIVPPEHPRSSRSPDHLNFDGRASHVQIGSQKEFAMSNMQAVTQELEAMLENNPDLTVILRADAATYYEEVQPVMAAISAAGVETVNLSAYMPGESPNTADTAREQPQASLNP